MKRVDLSNDESPKQESLRFKKVRQRDVSNSLSRMNMERDTLLIQNITLVS